VITTAYSTKLCCLTRLRRTELLWSPVVATVAIIGKSVSAQKPQEQSQNCFRGLRPLPPRLDGKEGVDGSSPSEGSLQKPR
jgi:hypothetical protein